MTRLPACERIVCAGEPGGSIPATRERIEAAWDARCFDHAGLTEVGAFTYPCAAAGGLHLREDEFICRAARAGVLPAGRRRPSRASSS